jgi:hypothetical protein
VAQFSRGGKKERRSGWLRQPDRLQLSDGS